MLKKASYILNKRDKLIVLLLLIIIIIGSFLEMGAVSVFSPFIDLIMESENADSGLVVSILYQIFKIDDRNQFLIVLAGTIIVIYVVKNIYTIWEKSLICRFSYGVQRRLSTNLLVAYMKEPYTFHLNKNISVMQRSLQNDTERFCNGLLHLMELVAEIFVCLSLFIYLFYVSKSLTIVVGSLLIICVGVFYLISRKYSLKWGKEAQQYNAKVYQWMNQSLGGIKELKVLNRENNFISNYDEYLAKYVRVVRLSRIIGIVPKYIIEMVSMAGMLLAVIIKLSFGYNDNVSVYISQLAVFAVAALRLFPSVGRINEHMAGTINALPSLSLIYNDIKEIEDIPPTNIECDDKWKFKNTIYINHVSYKYPDGDTLVIEDVSFDIKAGQTVAFIGASGAGKSTMVDILLGLLQPVSGTIYADDLNVFENLPTWQKEIGYIPQSIYLSDDTIINNVAFGVPELEINEDMVISALKKAQLYDFILDLPEGLNTFVGDRGVRLSGGQRQRIGIARALYHNPAILVLDEATSALDTDTEAAVMEAIDSLKGEKTIIIIAHRLSTIENADVVYEVKAGDVIEIKEYGKE